MKHFAIFLISSMLINAGGKTITAIHNISRCVNISFDLQQRQNDYQILYKQYCTTSAEQVTFPLRLTIVNGKAFFDKQYFIEGQEGALEIIVVPISKYEVHLLLKEASTKEKQECDASPISTPTINFVITTDNALQTSHSDDQSVAILTCTDICKQCEETLPVAQEVAHVPRERFDASQNVTPHTRSNSSATADAMQDKETKNRWHTKLWNATIGNLICWIKTLWDFVRCKSE
jgi:hypothetical protein